MFNSSHSSNSMRSQPVPLTANARKGEYSGPQLQKSNSNGASVNSDDDHQGSVHTIKGRRRNAIRRFFELGNLVEQQQRRLLSRHMLMLSIGGAIGTGIFLSSGQAVGIAGPGSALLSYIVSGLFIIGVVILLGEMCAAVPISGAYGSFAGRFVDRGLGFALGANYYLQWALTIPADVTASAIIIQFWLPNVDAWVWALVIVFPIFILQLLNVRAYGEIEYWSTVVKVLLVVLFIIVGLLYDWGAIPTQREPSPGLDNWRNGQAFFNGFSAFSQSLIYAFYSYLGSELVSLTSGEAINPQKTIPKSVRLTSLRMVLFNVFSILVVGLCINRNDKRLLDSAANSDLLSSPIVVIFDKAGFPKAFVHIINAIILTAVLSALNSAYYASTRIMLSMARLGLFPHTFGKVNSNGVPVVAVLITLLISFLAFLTTLWGAGVVFTWLQNLISIITLIAMTFTGVINIQFRRAIVAQGKSISDLPFKQPFYPFLPIATILVGLLFFAMQGYATKAPGSSWKNVLATYLGLATCIVSYLAYWIKYPRKCYWRSPVDCELIPGSIWDPEIQSVFRSSEEIDLGGDFDELHGRKKKSLDKKLLARVRMLASNI